ncbi:MAG: hypothetical protein H7336_11765 [Bacteriovorax sp.]|nr:hypothetical protein [Bacteriovorax sp.]
MTTKPNKKILVPPELSSSAMGIFFEELGFELNYKHITGHEYLFAVNDACPDVLNVPRLKTKDSIDPKLAPFVKSFISEDYVSSIEGRKLLTSYFNDGLEFDLVDRYSKDFKNIYTVKIHEYLNVGYFTDAIIVEAYKAKFNINILRNYLNAAMSFAFKKIETSEDSMPIDVSYSHSGEAFAVMISMGVDGFEGIGELKECLQILTENSNFFDVSYFHKKNKLTFSCLLFKDEKLAMKSYFFTEITNKSARSEEVEVQSELLSGLDAHDDIKYEAQKIPDEQSKKLSIARKFALFIRNYRQIEDSPKKIEKLEVSDVENYLDFYPRQESLKAVDDEIKNFILKLLKDDQLFNGISDYIKKVASSNLDSQIQEIQRVLGEKSLSDIEEILIFGGSPKNDQDLTRVKGWVEDGDISKWEVKRSQINEKIQDELIRISSEGRNIVQDDIIRIIAKELDAKENDIKVLVSGLVEEVVSNELVKRQKLEDAFALKILANQSGDQVREKLETQIVRMKKIMEQLKNELVKLQNEKIARNASDENTPSVPTDGSETLQLKAALSRTIEALKSKERFLEKIKSDFELLSKNKDLKIEALASKIEAMKSEYARSRDFANEEKLQQLEVENNSLVQRLELANKKVNIRNENIENRDNGALEKSEKEIQSLRLNMQKAQSVIERFKQDKLEMEARFNDEKENSRKLKEDLGVSGSGVSKEEVAEKDAVINILTSEKRASEEKLRAMTIELKKTEQKLKFTTSQLESASKRKVVPTPGQKSPEALAKDLEITKNKLAEVALEIAEKRKEVIKLKQENTMMSNKIAELEKKLGNADKKAS